MKTSRVLAGAVAWDYSRQVMSERPNSAESALDEWIAEIGEEGVAAVIEEARRQIEDGSVPGFTDKDQFLAYIQRGHRRRSA